jgi:hypothetical protein
MRRSVCYTKLKTCQDTFDAGDRQSPFEQSLQSTRDRLHCPQDQFLPHSSLTASRKVHLQRCVSSSPRQIPPPQDGEAAPTGGIIAAYFYVRLIPQDLSAPRRNHVPCLACGGRASYRTPYPGDLLRNHPPWKGDLTQVHPVWGILAVSPKSPLALLPRRG